MQDYNEILENKKQVVIESGFEIDEKKLNKKLKPFQKFCVAWALKRGKAALFEDCGLGKTFQQSEWANQVRNHTGKTVLILAPLAVTAQTVQEGVKFGIKVIPFLDEFYSLDQLPAEIFIINYEQLENIQGFIEQFAGVVLDESSILKNFTGAYKNLIIDTFRLTPYKLACTATPSPNDLNEIGNHSEFLDILDAQDMRSKWFVREEGMNNYRLKGHAKADFYGWIASWAKMFCNPSDIGFPEKGYNLPNLEYIERHITTENRNEGQLFNNKAINATNFNSELRLTKLERLSEVANIVNGSKEQFIIWIKQNEEGEELRKLIPDAVEVKGSDQPEIKKANLLGFAENKFRVLITKTKIAQFGLNYQNCHNQIFASLDFSFEGLYQAIRRSYRYGQKHTVNIYLITTDTMENVIKSIRIKEKQFLEMQSEMNKNINSKEYGLLHHYEYKEYRDEKMWLMKGDSCLEIDRLEDNSLDLIIFSPPFSSLFTYSNYIHDMGNNASHEDFFKQYAFLLRKMYAKLKPGRLMVCHTKDLGVYKNSSGYTGMYDFTAEHTRAVQNALADGYKESLKKLSFEIEELKQWISEEEDQGEKDKFETALEFLLKDFADLNQKLYNSNQVGFKLHSKVTIWCDPVLEMQRTKTQRLLYKTLTSNSALTGIGMAEYLTIFKKWDGTDESNWEPVNHLTKQNIPLDLWQKWASPVWMDIKRTDVLNGKEGTAMGDEKHIAPLQLEVIHRAVNLWSNPGDTVFTPFGGIGSEPYVSLNNNRKAIACELKDSYFDTMVKNCKKATALKAQGSLFETGVY